MNKEPKMKYINIFLASSIDDMKLDRIEIGNYIRSLNDRYVEDGIYFRLFMCEDISDEMAKSRKQDEYNKLIEECDYFYLMAWHKVGQFTREEFDVARKASDKSDASRPKISTFFKNDNSPVEDSVVIFMKELGEEMGHYYSIFTSIDTVKLKILLQMTDNGELSSAIEFKDSMLLIDGDPLKTIRLEKLPFYFSHKELGKYREEIDAIEKRIENAIENGEDKEKTDELKVKKKELQNALHEIEKKLLETSMSLIKHETNGKCTNMRTKRAGELFELGRLDEAIAILDDNEREEEYQRLLEKAELEENGFEAIINEILSKIHFLKNKPWTKENTDRIRSYYVDAYNKIFRHRLDPECIIDFMWFLRDQKDYPYAKSVGEKLYHYFMFMPDEERDPIRWARFCNDYGVLCRDEEEIDKAEKFLLEAFELRQEFARKDPERHSYDLSMTCNSLGILYRITDEFEKAKEIYKAALDHLPEITVRNILRFGGLRANICNNLGYLHLRTKAYDKAEALFLEARKIREQLETMQPGDHLIYLGRIENNLGELCSLTGRTEEAEARMKKGRELRQRSADVNPVEKAFVAGSCLSLAVLYSALERPQESEEMFLETLAVYKKYYDDGSSSYKAKYADAKAGLGDLYRKTGRLDESKTELDTALAIYRQLVKDTHGRHRPECARVCIEAGILYGELGNSKEAAALFEEARELLRDSIRANQAVYCGIEACAVYNHAIALLKSGLSDSAKDAFADALSRASLCADSDNECAQIAEKIRAASPNLPTEYLSPAVSRLYSI